MRLGAMAGFLLLSVWLAMGGRGAIASEDDAATESLEVGSASFSPPALPGGKVQTPFSEPYEWFHAGGGGRYLFFFLKKSKQIAVFDLSRMKVVRSIEVPSDDALAAAGRSKLLVVLPAQRLVLRYDLETLQREKSATIPGDQPVRIALLGSASEGPLAMWASGDVMLWNVDRMKPIAIAGRVLRGDPQHGYDLRMSADGRALVGWTTKVTGQRFATMFLGSSPPQLIETPDVWSSNGRWAMPSADAGLLFVYDGSVFNAAMQRVGGDSLKGKGIPFPTGDPRWFVVVRAGKDARRSSEVDLWTTGGFQPVLTIKDIEPVNTAMLGTFQGHCGGEPRVRYLPSAKLLITLPDGNDRMVVRRLDLIEELNHKGEDYLFVTSVPPRTVGPKGAYTYRIEAASKAGSVKYTLESAPKGMTVSSDGVLRWSPDVRARTSEAEVVVGLRDASGKEALHAFQIVPSAIAETKPVGPAVGERIVPPARRGPQSPARKAPRATAEPKVEMPETRGAASPVATDFVQADKRRLQIPFDPSKIVPV